MAQATMTLAAQNTGASSWFMSNPFRTLLVYSQLTGADYEHVVGMDIGHGEAMTYLFSRVQTTDENGAVVFKPSVERLRMNHEDDAKLPALIRFTNDKVIIGKKAKNAPGFFQHFKIEPAKWNTKIDAVHTHEYLMESFIRTLWEQVLQYQPKLAEAAAQGKVLLTVGCPASDDWTNVSAMTSYQKLLKRATNCVHVSVLPESTAAIMAAVLCAEETVPKHTLELEKGIAVLDPGSSTLDFTYVQLGKTLITRSLRLGGHNLDEQMLEVAMEDSGLTRNQIPKEQRQTLLVQLRELKEAFYPNRDSLGIQIIPIWGLDQNSKADADIPSNLQLKFTMNRAFMERALNRKGIQMNGHLSPKQSWLELCRDFVQYTKALIGTCDSVILTGGTSFVTELRDIVQETYGDQVIQSRDPSSSVAKGLCYAKSLEINGKDYVINYKSFAEKLTGKHYQAFIGELATYIAQVVCDDMKASADTFVRSGKPITVGNFVNDVNKRAQTNGKLTGTAGQEKVQELFTKHFSTAITTIYEEVNKISANIYGTNLQSAPKLSRLTSAQLDAMVQNLNLANVVNQAWITAIVPNAVFSVLKTVLFLVSVYLLTVGQLVAAGVVAMLAMALDNENFQQKMTEFVMKNNTPLKKGLLKKISANLADKTKREKNVKNASQKAAESMKKFGVLKPEFESSLQDQAEIALGKVLFLVYDNKPA